MQLLEKMTGMRARTAAMTIAAVAGAAVALPATAQDYYDDEIYEEHYEYEPGEGVHEEEWYDPSDWFDDEYGEQRVDYEEDDWWDWGYDYDYGYDDWGTAYDNYDDDYYDGYDYGDTDDFYGYDDYFDYGGDFGYGYDYSDRYGWGQPYGDQSDLDYGYYYDRAADEWEYGYHDDGSNAQNNQMRQQQQQAQRQSQSQQRQQQQAHRENQRRQQQAQAQRQAQLRGDVESYRRVSLQGQRDPHTVVRLRLENGRTALVNLGPRNPADLDIDQGDSIAVFGRRGTINDQPVLMAKRIRVEGDTTRIQRAAQRQMNQQRQMMDRQQMQQHHQRMMEQQRRSNRQQQMSRTGDRSRRNVQMQGTVQSFTEAQLRGDVQSFRQIEFQGQTRPHTVAKVRLENGRTALVNFGPRSISELGINEGDSIAVFGKRGTINDRPVLMANRVRIEGDTTRINRTSQRSGQRSR